VWFAFFAAAPAARAVQGKAPRLRVSAPVVLVFLAALVVGLARGPGGTGASRPLLDRALERAAGTPILATDLIGEQVALAGGRIWLGNPIDAFRHADQRRYLDWLEGRPAGDAALAEAPRVALVGDDSDAQKRLARDPRFRQVARDSSAILYVRRRS
jgi:hypothetical protein